MGNLSRFYVFLNDRVFFCLNLEIAEAISKFKQIKTVEMTIPRF